MKGIRERRPEPERARPWDDDEAEDDGAGGGDLRRGERKVEEEELALFMARELTVLVYSWPVGGSVVRSVGFRTRTSVLAGGCLVCLCGLE